jgi:hypothetical protein
VLGGSGDAESAALVLGAIATRDAVLSLKEALFEAEPLLRDAVGRALTAALRVGPERRPEDPGELLGLWSPILETLARP